MRVLRTAFQTLVVASTVSMLLSVPASGQASSGSLILKNVTVGNKLQVSTTVGFDRPLPPQGFQITVTSSDPTRVLLSLSPDAAGSASVVLNVLPNSPLEPRFYVQGAADNGTVAYSASSPGFASATGRVTLAPSGFVLIGPLGSGAGKFTAVPGGPSKVDVVPVMLSTPPNYVLQAVAGGVTATVDITNSNPGAGKLDTSKLVFNGGSERMTAAFHPGTPGTTVLSISTPPGFKAPLKSFTALTANVAGNSLLLSNDAVVGQFLQGAGSVSVLQPAPAGGLQVKLTSGNPAALVISGGEKAAGAASATVTIPAGETTGRFFLQGLGRSGTVTFTAAAPGFSEKSGSVTLAPSGVVLAGQNGLRGGGPFVFGKLNGGPSPVTVFLAVLNPNNTFSDVQPLRGGATPLKVALTSSNTGVGTINAAVTIAPGENKAGAQFNPIAQGSTTITLTQPQGFAGSKERISLTAYVTP